MRYIDFSSVKETIGKIYFGICICVFAYAVIGVPILLGMLKKHGVKTEAVITPNTSSWVHRYTTNCYLYEFQVGDKTYDGNSLVEEGDYRKIGTRVQVLYLDWYDAAMLVGMSEKEYSDYMRDKTAVAKGTDFVYRNIRYQVKANRPSGKKGSFVTMVPKASNMGYGT